MTERGPRVPERRDAPSYLRAARFGDDTAAAAAYGLAQEAVFAHPKCDLSVYRLLIDQVAHVTVLGMPPPADLDEQLTGILAAGDPTTLSDEITRVLVERRAQAKQIAPWVEGHYPGGKRLR